MSGLKELKVRLRSVSETKKITTAMKLVAAAKFRRAQGVFHASEPYAAGLASMFSALQRYAKVEGFKLPGFDVPVTKNKLFIVISADRGLCGSFNGQILRTVLKEVREAHDKNQDVKFICFGSKAGYFFKRLFPDKVHLVVSPLPIGSDQILDLLKTHIDTIADLLIEVGAENSYLYYNEFLSPIKQVPVKEKFLAGVEDDEADKEKASPVMWGIEPNTEAYSEQFLRQFIESRLLIKLLESSAGEQGARMFAMDNATRNADEMIDKLRLQYNRTRQAIITTELTEIISGAEAIA